MSTSPRSRHWLPSALRARRSILTHEALRLVVFASGALLACASAAACVRVLPWLLEPNLPTAVALPFARSLLVLACEAALVVGWPLGWALAAARLIDRGEARVLATLGESPTATARRLSVQGLALVSALGGVALLGGRDASAPGGVVQELLDEGERACAGAETRGAHVVPLVQASWLCAPGAAPRLVGRPPLAGGALTFSAARAHVSPDLGRFELSDARVVSGNESRVHVHVGRLVLRGLPPFARASALPAWLRALLLGLASAGSAFLAVRGLLQRGPRRQLTLHAVVIGVAGPLVALVALRQLETRTPALPLYAVVPLLAVLTTRLALAVSSRLPGVAHTGKP